LHFPATFHNRKGKHARFGNPQLDAKLTGTRKDEGLRIQKGYLGEGRSFWNNLREGLRRGGSRREKEVLFDRSTKKEKFEFQQVPSNPVVVFCRCSKKDQRSPKKKEWMKKEISKNDYSGGEKIVGIFRAQESTAKLI